MPVISTITDASVDSSGAWGHPVVGDKLGNRGTVRTPTVSLVGGLCDRVQDRIQSLVGLWVRPDRRVACCRAVADGSGLRDLGAREYATIASLVEHELSPEERLALGAAPWQLALASALERAADLVAEGRATYAREVVRGAVAFGAKAVGATGRASFPGHGVVPRLVTHGPEGEAMVLHLAAALMLAQPLRALVVAADGLASLVERILAEDSTQPEAREGERRARVRPRSRIDAFFSPSSTPRAVLEAVEQLMHTDGDDRSFGRVHTDDDSPYAFRDGSLHGEDIFGPGHDVASRHRDLRWGHMHFAHGYVHPALRPVIAEVLQRSVQDVGDASASTIREELRALPPINIDGRSFPASCLILEHVPVVPPAERPTALLVPEQRGVRAAQSTEHLEPDSTYRSLHRAHAMLARYAQLGAPAILTAGIRAQADAALARLLCAVVEPAPLPHDGWSGDGATSVVALPPRDALRDPDAVDDEDEPRWNLLWLNAKTLLVQHGDVATRMAATDGERGRHFELEGFDLQACDEGGRVVLVTLHSLVFEDSDDGEQLAAGIAAFDALTGAWLDALPMSLPPVTHDGHEPEDCTLHHLGRGAAIAPPSTGDRPGIAAYGHGNAYALTSEPNALVYETCSGLVVLDVGLARGDRPQSSRVLRPWPEDEREEVESAAAVARRSHGRLLILDEEGWLVDGEGPVARLDAPSACAAAFAPHGDRLAILKPGRIAIYDTTSWQLTHELDVSALASASGGAPC